MRPHIILAISSLVGLSTSSEAPSETDPVIKNANYIFNVIHDSMRQWGSSLHHNGVSFFLASVPAGTQLYHGTHNEPPITGPEWLAFEPEHALVFANPRGPGGSPPPKPDPKDQQSLKDNSESSNHRDELRRRHPHDNDDDDDRPPPHFGAPGYLHTYAAAKDLRLVYVDGEAAAKTDRGTLDSQDVVLLNITVGGSFGGERERAEKACQLANEEWGGRIDGLLRMEAGFEIILCSFERDLTLLRVSKVKGTTPDGQDAAGKEAHEADDDKKRRPGPGPDALRWLRAVSARYDGIGGHRVRLNFDSLVTAFAHDVDLFPGGAKLPRLMQLSDNEIKAIRQEMVDTILTKDPAALSWDWQATVDMIVKRYGDELSYFASGKVVSIESLRAEIELLMSPFTDYRDRNKTLEAERCATQFLPMQVQGAPDVTARAVHSVALRVCETLLEAAGEDVLGPAVEKVQALVKFLDWTIWKECRGCQDNEICVVPIWPMGSVEDYNHPKCKDASKPYNSSEDSYWGRRPHP